MSEDLTKKLPTDDTNDSVMLRNIDSRLQRLEQKVEERLYDTRPIWHKVVADIAQLHEGQRQLQESHAQLQEGQSRLEGEVRDMKITLRELARSASAQYEMTFKVLAECKDLSSRVLDIELEQQKQRNSST